VGEKIKADKILNREIAVLDYKIEQSKYEGKGQCIHMQIMVGDDKRVLFISGKKLMEALEQINKSDFPFKTTIVKENDWYEFT
jgi:hypothetical protein